MAEHELLQELSILAGPLRPLESLDQRLTQKEEWIRRCGQEQFGGILNILQFPPSESILFPTSKADFNQLLSDVMVSLGKSSPARCVQSIGPLLANDHARPIVIEVIGALRQPEGVDWLKKLVNTRTLAAEELLCLVCALGEIGSADARVLLEELRDSIDRSQHDVHDEITLALRNSTDTNG